jgi:NAD+ diphosphatase
VNRSETRPENVIRHCPRCGASGFKAEAHGRFECAGCAFVFYLDVAAAVAAIIRDQDGRVLLTRRAHDPERGKLDIPGGFVDAGEAAEDALRREVREELGLEIEELTYACTQANIYEYRGLTYHTLDVYFSCRVRDLAAIRSGDDINGFAFLALDEIPTADIGFDSVRRALARLANG